MNGNLEGFHTYDAPIWVRFFGTLFTKVAQMMMYPYLVLYMTSQLHAPVLLSTAIIGLESLAGLCINLFFGGLSDRFGRKRIMMLSLSLQAIALLGFLMAHSLLVFGPCLALLGGGAYMFFPAADAQIADIVEPGKRAEVYGLLGTAANIGNAMGPFIGMLVFRTNPRLAFAFFAGVSLLYLLLVWWKIPETLPADLAHQAKENKINTSKLNWSEQKGVFTLMFLTVPISLLAANMWSNLPFHLQGRVVNADWVYSTILTVGALFSVLQFWVGKRTENDAPARMVPLSYVLVAIGCACFAFLTSFWLLLLATLLMEYGSMVSSIHLNKLVSVWAPADKRGRYFSIYGLHWRISEMSGPFVGALLLHNFGGSVMFSVIALLLVVGATLQRLMVRRIERQTTAREAGALQQAQV